MTGADFRAHELADDLGAAGWTVTMSGKGDECLRTVTVTACKPGCERASVTWVSVTDPGKHASTRLASAVLDIPHVGTRTLDGPRGLRAWLDKVTRNIW